MDAPAPSSEDEMPIHPLSTNQKDVDSTKPGSFDLGRAKRVDVSTQCAIVALAAAYTASSIHSYFVGPAIGFIAQDLKLGSRQSWVPVSSSLASACVAPCVGYIQDLLGHKVTLAGGMLLSSVAMILIGTGQGLAQLVAGSALAGLASAMQELTAIAAIAELVPVNKRGAFLALNTGMSLLFTPTLLYVELIANNSTWRWLFWIALIWNGLTIVALALTYFRMHVSADHRRANKFDVRQVDVVGILLLVPGLTLFLVALQSGGQEYDWNSAYVLSMLIVSVALLAVFVFWESRCKGRPLIPFRLFRGQRVVALSLVIGVFGGIDYYTVLNLGPDIIHAVFDKSPVGYGVLALGPSISLAVGATTLNIALSLLNGHARELLLLATTFMTAFSGAQSIINPSNSAAFAILGSFAALGIGAVLVPIITLVTVACPEDLTSTAIALTSASRTIGGSIGYALLFNVFLSHSGHAIPVAMAPQLVEAGLPRNETATFIKNYITAVTSGQTPSGGDATILAAARTGFQLGTAESARLVYYISIAFGAPAMIAAVALPDIRKYMTTRVVARSTRTKT